MYQLILFYFIFINCKEQFLLQKSITKYEDFNFTILDQTSSNVLPYIICQNITDMTNFPTLKSADDFIIPPLSTFIINNIPYGLDTCRAVIFSISYKRSRYTEDPKSIVLSLMRDNNSGPGTVFWQKTFPHPLNSWNINTNNPGVMILQINIGEIDDLGNEFDLSSNAMGYNTKIWVSFYVNLNRNFSITGYRENIFYWIIYDIPPNLQLTEIDSPYKYYYKTSPYYFIDYNNLLRKDLTHWSIAQNVERLLGINSDNSFNLAWQVQLLCKQTLNIIDINVTKQPTPTPNPYPTIDNNTKEPPFIISDNNRFLQYGLIFSLLCLIIVILLLFIFYCKRLKKKDEIINLDDILKFNDSNDQNCVIHEKYKDLEDPDNNDEITNHLHKDLFVDTKNVEIRL